MHQIDDCRCHYRIETQFLFYLSCQRFVLPMAAKNAPILGGVCLTALQFRG